MITISIGRCLELDEVCGEEVQGLLKSGLDLCNMFDEDYARDMQTTAKKLGIPFDEFRLYVCWKGCINSLLSMCSLGDLGKLEGYLRSQILIRQNELIYENAVDSN